MTSASYLRISGAFLCHKINAKNLCTYLISYTDIYFRMNIQIISFYSLLDLPGLFLYVYLLIWKKNNLFRSGYMSGPHQSSRFSHPAFIRRIVQNMMNLILNLSQFPMLITVVHGAFMCGQKKLYVSVEVPPSPFKVPSQWSLAPTVTSVTSVC